jgi:hypothetical protein
MVISSRCHLRRICPQISGKVPVAEDSHTRMRVQLNGVICPPLADHRPSFLEEPV